MIRDNTPHFYAQTNSRYHRLFVCLMLCLVSIDSSIACPFCVAESQTLTEEINGSTVVLLARLVEPSQVAEVVVEEDIPYGFVDPSSGAAKFSVEQILKGKELMPEVDAPSKNQIEAIYFGEPDLDTVYFIRGLGTPPDWNIPMPLTQVAVEYVPKLFALPESGGDRLDFFQDYLQHEDTLLSQDAYDEFARAPYQDLIDLDDRMDREKLVAWIQSPSVSPSRRRLFLTMLGVCGTGQDRDAIEKMISSDARLLGPCAEATVATAIVSQGAWSTAFTPELVRVAERQRKLGLDAMIACYLTLCGKQGEAGEGLDLIDKRFLKDPNADYTHIYSSLMALRFLGEEQAEMVPLERVLESARLLLDSAEFADQIIPDLSRWEDWSVLSRLTEMYEKSFEPNQNKYVREPIITYLDVAIEQSGEVGEQAQAALAKVEPLDPDAVRRARSLRAFGFLAQARAKEADQNDSSPLPEEETEVVKELEDEIQTAEAPSLESPDGIQSIQQTTPESTMPTPGISQAAGDKKLKVAPPSRLILIGSPLVAATLCFGLLWWILRGSPV